MIVAVDTIQRMVLISELVVRLRHANQLAIEDANP